MHTDFSKAFDLRTDAVVAQLINLDSILNILL